MGFVQTSSGKLVLGGIAALLLFIFFMSGGSSNTPDGSQYAVVIDAGSSGSRVHVYEVKNEDGTYQVVDELFEQLKPGLSAYKHDPPGAAASLDPLLDAAMKRVPASAHSSTSIALGATAGLRMIGDQASTKILEAVRTRITGQYDFKLNRDQDIRILDGNEEGKYAWIAVNTLLGQIGKDPIETYPACDLGGGSVQCMFAMPKGPASLRLGVKTSNDAPPGYVETVSGGGRSYDLYVHSFLGYGLLAARMAVLKASTTAASACMPKGFADKYSYGDDEVNAAGDGSASFETCHDAVRLALKTDSNCGQGVSAPSSECTVDGQWNGGLSAVLKAAPNFKLHVMSFFFERTKSVGAGSAGKQLDENEDESSLAKLRNHARIACGKSLDELESDATVHMDYPEDLPYLCLDVVYIYSFLLDGIGLDTPDKYVMEKKIKNSQTGKEFEAAWSLGMAMEIL